MPEPPRKGESKSAFVGRCISYLIKNEGKTQKQAAWQCYGMWEQSKKKSSWSDNIK